MINVKFDQFIAYAKWRSQTADRMFYDAWLSVGYGLKRQDSATVTLSVARQPGVPGDEETTNGIIQNALGLAMANLPKNAAPKDAFAYMERAEQEDQEQRATA